MSKPVPKTIHDYTECMDYISEKHNFNDRDYYGYWDIRQKNQDTALQKTKEKFGNTSFWPAAPTTYTVEQKEQSKYYNRLLNNLNKNLPKDLDFWGDVLVDHYGITNGCVFTVYEDIINDLDCEEYHNIIIWLMDEFGSGENGSREIEFQVSW